MIQDNIRNLTGDDILKKVGIKRGELDILDGSPPCESFSMSGKREKGWGKIKRYSENVLQRTDDLFFEFIRIAKDIYPKVIIAENVKGLTQGKAIPILQNIIKGFQDIGYICHHKVLYACDYGVAQLRPRVIFVCVRKDIYDGEFNYPHPTHTTHIPVKSAISNIINDPAEVEMLLDAGKKYTSYRHWDTLKIGSNSKINFNTCRNHWDTPSYTLPKLLYKLSLASVLHPHEKRKHTIAEVKRIMGFPDDYILTGTWAQKWI